MPRKIAANRSYELWSEREIRLLHSHLDQGWGYATIAKKIGRSAPAVRQKCLELGRCISDLTGFYYTEDIAQDLGVDRMKVRYWIAQRWIRVIKMNDDQTRNIYAMPQEEYINFLEDPNFWMLWRPEKIPDSAFREWAYTMRAEGPEWITIAQAVAAFPFSRVTIQTWIERGYVQGVSRGFWWVDKRELAEFIKKYDDILYANRCEAERKKREQRNENEHRSNS